MRRSNSNCPGINCASHTSISNDAAAHCCQILFLLLVLMLMLLRLSMQSLLLLLLLLRMLPFLPYLFPFALSALY